MEYKEIGHRRKSTNKVAAVQLTKGGLYLLLTRYLVNKYEDHVDRIAKKLHL